SLAPMGDLACLLHLDDEEQAWRLASAVRTSSEPWIVDVVQAYRSVAVFFDLQQVRFAQAADRIQRLELTAANAPAISATLHRIPCCYALEMDLDRVATITELPRDEIIRLHCERTYTVYAIGFCPGFPFLGYLPTELQRVPRLDSPRTRVEPGSVGMTG